MKITQLLRNISVRSRLYAMTTMITLLLILPLGLLIVEYQNDLLQGKKEKTRHLVETAYTLVNYYHNQEQKGALTQQAAQEAAKVALSKLRYGNDDYFWVNDLEPSMIMHPIKPALNGKNLSAVQDPTGKKLFLEFVDVVNKQQEGFVSYMWPKPGMEKDIDKLSYIKLFKPWKWIIGSGVYIDDIQALFWSRIQSMALATLACFLLLLLVAKILGSTIIKPCHNIQMAMDDIAQGEGDLTQQLTSQGKDEFNRIALAFNLFTSKIREVIKNMAPVGDSLVSAAQQLSDSSDVVVNAADNQKRSLEELVQDIHQLSNNSHTMVDSANTVNTTSSQVCQIGVDGTKIVETAAEQMETLSELLNKTQQNTSMLAEDSNNVVKVLEVIREIAEQTNLLSLNASIEAARAGEHGRGFAVVAEEVRSLAMKTQTSTNEIEKIISGLQQRSDDMFTVVNNFQLQSDVTRKSVLETQNILLTIYEEVNRTAEYSVEIAEAGSRQQSEIENIINKLTQVSEESIQVSEQAQYVSQCSHHLLESGDILNQTIAQFKT